MCNLENILFHTLIHLFVLAQNTVCMHLCTLVSMCTSYLSGHSCHISPTARPVNAIKGDPFPSLLTINANPNPFFSLTISRWSLYRVATDMKVCSCPHVWRSKHHIFNGAHQTSQRLSPTLHTEIFIWTTCRCGPTLCPFMVSFKQGTHTFAYTCPFCPQTPGGESECSSLWLVGTSGLQETYRYLQCLLTAPTFNSEFSTAAL